MNIEEVIKYIKNDIEIDKDTASWFEKGNKTKEQIEESIDAYETLLTAYEKEKETSHYNQSQLDIANAKLVEEKEKNSKLIEALDIVNHEKGVFIESYEKEKEKNKEHKERIAFLENKIYNQKQIIKY